MNPLAKYLVSRLKNEETNETRVYRDTADALEELGYWLLERPDNFTREQMPPCSISKECVLIDEFPSYQPSIAGYDGFKIIVDVYADPGIAD